MSPTPATETATLAGGCFWCLEPVFEELQGVISVEPGYAGGSTSHPTYRQVTTGTTGHAEAVQITFDPRLISFREIIEIFFTIHDPTTLNRQGADVGSQYRSAIFYHSPEQKETAEAVIRDVNAAAVWDRPIVTELAPFDTFYPAEAEHRHYFQRHPEQPYCQIVIEPKVTKFRERFREKLKG